MRRKKIITLQEAVDNLAEDEEVSDVAKFFQDLVERYGLETVAGTEEQLNFILDMFYSAGLALASAQDVVDLLTYLQPEEDDFWQNTDEDKIHKA